MVVAIACIAVAQFALQLEETPRDKQVAAELMALDKAVVEGKSIEVEARVKNLKQMGGRNAVDRLLKAPDAQKRALAIFGLRMLQVRNAWSDVLIMLADPQPVVRRQVYLYAPVARVDLTDIKQGLADFVPEVRLAAINGIVKIGTERPKSAKQAAALLRAKLGEEKDANVRRGLEVGLLSLGEPVPSQQPPQ